jgi:hypothetical protein
MRSPLLAAALAACASQPAPADPWIETVHTLSVWPLDEATRARFGVDVNGTWADGSPASIAMQHRRGQRVIVSVQGLAGEAGLLAEHPALRAAVSKDLHGEDARVPWYDWLDEPVLTLSIASPVFEAYLIAEGVEAVDAGADGWFVDEIQTSALLISREPHGAGFADFEMQAFLDDAGQPSYAAYLEAVHGVAVPAGWDARAILRDPDPGRAAVREAFFADYRAFHEELAFRRMTEVIARVRAHATARGRDLAIGANLAGLGALAAWSPLTVPIWTGSLDFLVFEHDPPDLQASFAPYYQLGRATVPGMVAAMPGLELAARLHAQGEHDDYLRIAYAEAFAFEGNWGLSYWTEELGWEPDALLPAALEPYTRFVREHRALYEGPRSPQQVVVIYPAGEVLADPSVHGDFVAICDQLLARHVPFDVAYEGDARFRPQAAEVGAYRTVLRPGAPIPDDLVVIEAPDDVLAALYRRDRLDGPVLHLVNRRYDDRADAARPLDGFSVSIPAPEGGPWRVTWHVPGRAPVTLANQRDGDRLRIEVPGLDVYGVAQLSAAQAGQLATAASQPASYPSP